MSVLRCSNHVNHSAMMSITSGIGRGGGGTMMCNNQRDTEADPGEG